MYVERFDCKTLNEPLFFLYLDFYCFESRSFYKMLLTAIFLQPAAFKLSGSVIELPLISSATHHSNITDHICYTYEFSRVSKLVCIFSPWVFFKSRYGYVFVLTRRVLKTTKKAGSRSSTLTYLTNSWVLSSEKDMRR